MWSLRPLAWRSILETSSVLTIFCPPVWSTSEASNRKKSGFSKMIGMRSWICWVSSLVVTMAVVPCNSFAFSQRPANAMGSPSRRKKSRYECSRTTQADQERTGPHIVPIKSSTCRS